MSKAAQQARQIVIDELDQIEQETLDLWRNHVNSIKLKESITVDPEIVTEEHESLLKDAAIELRTASMSSSQREALQDKYNWLLSNEEDAARVKGIRDRGRVPPPILGGSEDDWWVVDGMHRIAILANDGVENFPAYFMTGIRNIKNASGEVIEKQLPIDEASKQVLLDLRIDLLKDELDTLSERLYSGDISIGQFQEDFKALIKGGRTSAAAIGKGGWDQMGPRDWGRLGTPLREEYKFLKGFVETIEQNKDTITLKYIKNRARMYADNIVAAAVQAEAGFFFEDNLPFLPRDGTTRCLSGCHCSWILIVIERKKNFQVVEATWVLGEADHCETCVSREGYKEVLKVPNDVDVPAKIGGY